MVFARAEVAFLSRSYYWKQVTQEEAVLLDLLAEESPARAGTGCFCLIQILCPVSYMPLTEVQRSLLRCKPHSGNWEAALEAPCRSPCWHLSGSITECLVWEGWGCRGSPSSSSSLLTACWKSRLWQLTKETKESQKSLPGILAISQGQWALPQPACHPFYGVQQGLGVATCSHSTASTRSGFGEHVQGLNEHNYLYAMLHISGLLCISGRSLPDCLASR